MKKISHPDNHEYAIGAVGLQGAYIDPQHRSISERYLKREIDIQRAILRRRMVDYHLKPVDVAHRTVMIVDDGIATCLTIRYAVEIVRSQHPRCIVVVSPIASYGCCAAVASYCRRSDRIKHSEFSWCDW